MASPGAQIRVHGELADLLPADERGHPVSRPVDGTSTVKHVVESLGLAPVRKTVVVRLIPPGALHHHDAFTACTACGKVYWEGSHHARISRLVTAARSAGTDALSSPT